MTNERFVRKAFNCFFLDIGLIDSKSTDVFLNEVSIIEVLKQNRRRSKIYTKMTFEICFKVSVLTCRVNTTEHIL